MNVERIRFERTGGFAGMTISKDLEMNELSQEQAHQVLQLLDELAFKELPEEIKRTEAIPDEFTYAITVETGKWTHTVVTGDSSAPEKMQELLHLLTRLARPGNRQ